MATTTALLLAAIIGIALVWWLAPRSSKRRAPINGQGVQELEVTVLGRYRPNVIIVKRGIPVRLNFSRQEETACSERVIFEEFHHDTRLLPYQTTPVEFVPSRSGQYLFTCAMGMYQGTLVVEEPSPGELRLALSAGKGVQSLGTHHRSRED